MQPEVIRLSRGLYRIYIPYAPEHNRVRWFRGNERNAHALAKKLDQKWREVGRA